METLDAHGLDPIAVMAPERTRVVSRSERPTPMHVVPAGWESAPLDDARQLAVVVWARTKMLQQVLGDNPKIDPRVLNGLAEIDGAIAALGARLDALEDARQSSAA